MALTSSALTAKADAAIAVMINTFGQMPTRFIIPYLQHLARLDTSTHKRKKISVTETTVPVLTAHDRQMSTTVSDDHLLTCRVHLEIEAFGIADLQVLLHQYTFECPFTGKLRILFDTLGLLR